MKTILAPVDFSDATPLVAAAAQKLAQAFGARIVLLHVVEPEPVFVGYETGPETIRIAVAGDVHQEHQQLEAVKASLPGLDVIALQIQGPVAEKILHESVQQHADYIVLGSHGHGALYHLLAGSVTSAVLRRAGCPVLVVPVHPTTG
ncbi:MAG: hypothetical protein QOD99_2577 [Chthoniobacter sp.]|jgi:nucleotide-binding universal stress UspA family protein|nr:hypothetical protein [Chthoniobacter sp.]